MKLTDYLAQYLVDLGVKKVFLMNGGSCAHIVDSLGKNKDIGYVCIQHEQAAAMAADAYARITKNIGVAVATSGPGATNLITGVCCSYFDSIPTLIITGQVNLWETKGDRKIRQLGFQETDIIDIVRPMTKFAVMVRDPEKIRYFLDKAVHIAKSGRPGPVWLDIPMNVQHAEVNPDTLEKFSPQELEPENLEIPDSVIEEIRQQLKKAKRPVIIAGGGIKIGNAEQHFIKFLKRVPAPVVSSWSGFGILPYDHPLYIGQIGVYGSRAANFAVQNSDLLISLGSRLDTRQTGGQPKTFAREAVKIVVDIDETELNKQWVVPDIPVHANVSNFLQVTALTPDFSGDSCYSDWLSVCRAWKEKYPAVLPEYNEQKNSVNAYVFLEALSSRLPAGAIVITDLGGNTVWTIQTLKLKDGQTFFSAMGHAPMGYAVPAAIGAALASPGSPVICISGDGGFQINIQELQTIVHYNLPIKVFILNNNSYGIIKQFQEVYFRASYEATVNETGYTTPDFVKVARAYGLAASRISNHTQITKKLDLALNTAGPFICDVKLDEAQKLIPKLVAIRAEDGRYISKPIEDMSPLLPREEFKANMIVKPLPEEDTGNKKSSEIN